MLGSIHRLLRAQAGSGTRPGTEYVEAARAEGLRVGFYYSLMDWHHPDGATARTTKTRRKRFVEYTHGLIRELHDQLRQGGRSLV